MTELKIIVQEEEEITFVTLKGILDADSCSKLEETFNEIEQDVYKLIIDLSLVDYISSQGIRVLIKMREVVGNNGGNMMLLDPKPDVRKVFELVGLNHLFTILGTGKYI